MRGAGTSGAPALGAPIKKNLLKNPCTATLVAYSSPMTTIQLNEGAEQKTRYGKNIIGKPVRTEGHCWIRVDTYVNSQGEEHRERRFCLGARDFSPMFIAAYAGDPGNGRYHPNCSGCYLGHSHTLAEHEAHAVGEWR